MEKKLQKDNMQLRCMWGFHHFHRSSRNQKLLSNGRTLQKNPNGKLQPTKVSMLAKRDDDECHNKIKNPVQKEKPSEKKKKKHSKEDNIGLFDHLIEKYKAERNASLNPSPISCPPNMAEKREPNKSKVNLAAILEDICNHIHVENKDAKRNIDPGQPSNNKIVVLKPMPRRVNYTENVACNCSYLASPQSSSSKRNNGKNTSFSLADIKRKLKSAMGEKWKEQKLRTLKEENIKVVKTSSARMKNKIQESGNGPEMSCMTETVSKKMNLSKKQEFDIFMEAKRHLSKRLTNMSEDEPLEISQAKTLAKILDSPERDFWANGHKYVTETNEAKSPSDTTKSDFAFYSQCSILDSPSKSPDRGSSLDVSSSSPSSSLSVFNFQLSASSFSARFVKHSLGVTEDIKDKKDHPSPVSVLDMSFMEDVDSPTSLPEKPSEMILQPRRLNFEEYSSQEDSPLNPETKDVYMDNEDTISSYIESALQAFYLFDEPELSSLDMDRDPDLLLDYINEVLLETYHQWLSFPGPKFPPEKDLVLDKVMNEVKNNLCPVTEQPTLDWLVAEDLAKPGLWLDLRIDSAAIVSQIADEILEESIMELLL